MCLEVQDSLSMCVHSGSRVLNHEGVMIQDGFDHKWVVAQDGLTMNGLWFKKAPPQVDCCLTSNG